MPRRGDIHNGTDPFNRACRRLSRAADRIYDIGKAGACKALMDQMLRIYNKDAYVPETYHPPTVLATNLQNDYPELWEDCGEDILGPLLSG